MNRLSQTISIVAVALFGSFASRADITIPGANNGSDGHFNCGTFQNPPNPAYPCGIPCSITTPLRYTMDLAQAKNARWNDVPPVPGLGVYDADKWAVVYKFDCVDIPSNVTIVFKNHPTHAPVVWLVQGQVKIDGQIVLNGASGHGTDGHPPRTFAEPGPGGFRGGRGSDDSVNGAAGLGPGGPNYGAYDSAGSGGSYAWQGGYGDYNRDYGVSGAPGFTYGNSAAIPLFGGSGGGGGNDGSVGAGGGGGGGAILIATKSSLILNGNIQSYGGGGGGGQYARGGGGGSSGSIRLIADSVAGTGKLYAPYGDRGCGNGGRCGGYGAGGSTRIDANSITLTDIGSPPYSIGSAGTTALLWPEDVGPAPNVRIASVSGQTVNTDPRASLNFPGADATVPSSGSQLVLIDAVNVPLDWSVYVRVVPTSGFQAIIPAGFSSGDATHSTWSAIAPIGSGFSIMQARAYKPSATAGAGESEATPDGTSTDIPPQLSPSDSLMPLPSPEP